MKNLSSQRRFEEAAETRDRAFALASVLSRDRGVNAIRTAGRLIAESRGFVIEIENGSLAAVGGRSLPVPPDQHPDEARMLWRWLSKDRNVILRWVERGLSMPEAGGRSIDEWIAKQTIAKH